MDMKDLITPDIFKHVRSALMPKLFDMDAFGFTRENANLYAGGAVLFMQQPDFLDYLQLELTTNKNISEEDNKKIMVAFDMIKQVITKK